jgi:hypothetical protein
MRGEFNDAIHCSLQTVSLVDRPQYTALSYVWGDAHDLVPVIVDGSVFMATKNLRLALQYIRQVDRDKILWVDAICINQNDIEERNNQLSLMGALYSEAEEVIIWLGEADETTHELACVVQETGLPIVPATDAGDHVESDFQYIVRLTRVLYLLQIVALRPWWSRVWTVQECVLPRSDPIFRCGFQIFPWESFFAVFSNIPKISLQNQLNILQNLNIASSTQEIRQIRDRLSKGATDEELQRNHRAISILGDIRKHWKEKSELSLALCTLASLERQASVPHDYIYGVLGLVTTEVRDKIRLDYRRSFWLGYREFFKTLISTAPEGLEALSAISFHKETDEQPSWLPDFSKQRDVVEHTGWFLDSESCFRSLEMIRWTDGDEILNLEGIRLDVVDQVYDMQKEDDEWMEHILAIATKVEKETDTKMEALSGNSPLRKLVEVSKTTHISQLFHGSCRSETSDGVSDSRIKTCWDTLTGHHSSSISYESVELRTTRAELGGLSLMNIVLQILQQTLPTCRGRSVLISRAGISGICVPNVQPRDEIVCFYGFSMPFILRSSHGHYRIIGAARLRGLTDWVALTECQKNGLLPEATFRIR